VSMSITYNWSGGRTPLQRFKALDAVKTWSDENGPKVLSALKDATPVYRKPPNDPRPRPSGRMRQSERYARTATGSAVTMSFNAYVPYTKYVIKPTAGHEIAARQRRTLLYYNTQGAHFPRSVWHPGTKGNNFPKRVMDDMRDGLTASLMEKLREALEAS
jgi:hypothetical protein